MRLCCQVLIFQLLALIARHSVAIESERPNILAIVVDDLGYGELGCYGGTQIPTPNIDALAASGVRFTNGYVTAPFCAASRAGLLTGRYQTRFGFEFNPIGAKNAEPGIGLPVGERTIADSLRDRGYATALVGKWHLGGTAPFHPNRRGFDEFFGFLHEGHFYVPQPWNGVTTWLRRTALPDGSRGRWLSHDARVVWSTHMNHREPDYDADNPLLRCSQPVAESEFLTDAFSREACDFIERHRHQPWFLCLAYNAVHSPLQAKQSSLSKFAHIEDIHRRIFAALLSDLDENIGRLTRQVADLPKDRSTIIVFVSDNGGPTKELTSSNGALRGGKGELWEGGIRVPFIVAYSGRTVSTHVVDTPVSTLDLYSTIAKIVGLKSEGLRLDGVDLGPDFSSQELSGTGNPRTLYWRVGKKNAIRKSEWKMIRDDREWKLYNLRTDPSEQYDVASQNAAKVNELSLLWTAWDEQQSAPKWY
jgi:arylsulfatase A-like enzyme